MPKLSSVMVPERDAKYRDDVTVTAGGAAEPINCVWAGPMAIVRSFTMAEMIELFSLMPSASRLPSTPTAWLNNRHMPNSGSGLGCHLEWHMEHQKIDYRNGARP